MNEVTSNEAEVEVAATSTKSLADFTSTKIADLGESLGEFKAYDNQLTIAEITGTRVVKCLYQVNTKTGVKAGDNSYVRIPTSHLTEELIANRIAELTPYVLTYLQGIEDANIKADHKAGIVSVYTENLSLDKIIESLESSEAGSRLNKEKIEAWFNADCADKLAALFMEKLGIDVNCTDEVKLVKLEAVMNAYKDKFTSLAGGKTYIKEEDCQAMISVITSCDADKSLIGSRFVSRLTKMMTKVDDTLLSL